MTTPLPDERKPRLSTNPFTRARQMREAQAQARVLGSPLNQAMTFLRNTVAASPEFGDQWSVTGIDTEPQDPDMLWLHLSNGRTIILHVEVDTGE